MTDRVVNFTKAGSLADGVQTGSFYFDTQTNLGDSEATYIYDLVFSLNFDVASYTLGGRWGGAFIRTGGNLTIPAILNVDIYRIIPPVSVGTWTTMAVSVIGNDTIKFDFDTQYTGGNKYWRAWLTFYGKDQSV